MRGGTFNLLYGRDPLVVKMEVDFLVHHYDLDYLGVQESTDYRVVLHDIPGYSYYTGGSVNGGASTEVGMLVREDHTVTNIKNKSYGDGWWSGIAGRKGVRMQPRNFLTLTINGKHRKGVCHFPPSVDLKERTPDDRYWDYAALSKRLLSFFSGPSFKTREVMMDANCEPHVRIKYSPGWVAGQTGATLSSPDDRIDYILTKGLRVLSIEKVKTNREDSDHNLVIFVTRPRYRRKIKD